MKSNPVEVEETKIQTTPPSVKIGLWRLRYSRHVDTEEWDKTERRIRSKRGWGLTNYYRRDITKKTYITDFRVSWAGRAFCKISRDMYDEIGIGAFPKAIIDSPQFKKFLQRVNRYEEGLKFKKVCEEL